MSSPQEDLLELFATLGQQVLAQTTTDGALSAVTHVAVGAIPTVAYASITRHRDGRFQTVGATHPDATVNDQLQYELLSGPCLDACSDVADDDADETGAGRGDRAAIVVADLAHDVRYPTFGPGAAANGATSMMSLRMLFDTDDVRASLNLYSHDVDGFDDDARTVALLMATHAALAVTGVVARENAASLTRALDNSRSIGMAIGILMASVKITSGDAFALLRIASQTHNRKLAQIAADVVDTGTLDLPELS